MNALSVVLNGTKMNKLRTGPWNLTDLDGVEKNGFKVFSCFHCGGGSTMGYKLAGFDVVGGVEIDPEMMSVYKANHNPKHSYLMGIQEFNKIPIEDIPQELLSIDILDGSPPCSSFSMAGSRDEKWGIKKKFREGQSSQILDDLFFHYIETAKKLQPKIVVAENVKGLIIGKAKGYVKQIFQKFDEAGYDAQLFLLNAAFMGVPQKRERTVFIAKRKDLKLKKLTLNFNEDPINLETAFEGLSNDLEKLTAQQDHYWNLCKPGESFSKYHPKGSLFGQMKVNPKAPSNTLTTKMDSMFHWKHKRYLDLNEWRRIGTFPEDYNGLKKYLIGMSVPPFMMQRIANQIHEQWLSKLPKTILRKK